MYSLVGRKHETTYKQLPKRHRSEPSNVECDAPHGELAKQEDKEAAQKYKKHLKGGRASSKETDTQVVELILLQYGWTFFHLYHV